MAQMKTMKKLSALALVLPCFVACTPEATIQEGVDSEKFVIWSTESDPRAKEVLKDVELQLERMHLGTDVVIETVGWGDVSERLINARSIQDYPDISHIQPFMAYSLYSRELLLPITDVWKGLETDYGPILPAVRDLQVFGENRDVYGIAYAVGTTFWSVRTDMVPENVDLTTIKTWDQYLKFVEQSNSARPDGAKVTLPGGSPFFVDQLFGELVANAGGKLFDENKCPILTSPEVVSSLTFFSKLSDTGALANNWASQSYTDQFSELARGDVFSAPVTYARASRTILDTFKADPILDANNVDDGLVYWLDQPVLNDGLTSIATIDAEPWVIFSSAEKRVQSSGIKNEQIAKDFLKIFYSPENYKRYTQSVPVHLTPIFERMANSPEYVAKTVPFKRWHEKTLSHLRAGTTRPILMPDLSDAGKTLPFLLEFQRSGILSGAVTDVIQSGATPEEAAKRAQVRALQIVRRQPNAPTCSDP